MENIALDITADQATPNQFMCDLIKLQLNQPIRPDLMKTYLESHKSPETTILFSIPILPQALPRGLILLSTSIQVLVTNQSLLFINCSEDIKSLCQKVFPRSSILQLAIHEEKDPYLSLTLCQELLTSDCEISDGWVGSVDVNFCKSSLKEFIYKISKSEELNRLECVEDKFEDLVHSHKEETKSKLSQIKSKSEVTDSHRLLECRASWELESESTYEESFNQQHGYQKTWDFQGGELYKVTEYNESLECSVSDEGSDLATKLNEFSMKATNSIADRFPKLSFASLSLSENSYQNIYESFKKSLNYNEGLDILPPSPEKLDDEFPKLQESFPVSSTQICTLSDSNTFKSALENRAENCNCTKCAIF